MNADEIARIFLQLSERQRTLLWHVAVEGYKFTEIAKSEGKSESAVRKAYNRAIAHARKIAKSGGYISQRGIGSKVR
ncbi:RNA polymerase sigma factor [Alloscardovia venturai]|uniref:RNA polymerase sigma factor n=1 Tax=Alloscardovia venturai TaxID=1769421 RepID=A0ABW2Y5A8_9BIFI